MKYLRRRLTRLANSTTSRQDGQRLKEEIELHIALQTEENLRASLSPAEARRLALGAAGTEVMRVVLRDALWMVCAGLAVGAPLALWGKRVAASLIAGLPAASLLRIVVAAAIMMAVGLLAACLPARRALLVDPMVALRHD